ncbi:hypothetical protein G0U57_017521 [Chelydra serpentina]|uniref:RNase H type-1 domain-containing protein n=1 Tax=Chelydra serpentina TaxID=8475 RepID=A0A8T1TFY5_CHESE|nr:hypothetical protein G0U57_017521 [Chelydra serpentina]
MDLWVVDGSCQFHQCKPYAGYAALQVSTDIVLQGTVIPKSAQAAEIIAIVAPLDASNNKAPMTICSDSS